ncbi:IclR family transcriptional regulator [Streptomyces sp. NPDC051320]|uniref:IclR family transcriptional regulator n=1 Tax=Streptomyces sp. NPDC051320 TaxID=3154644 RepID=UPI0034146571
MNSVTGGNAFSRSSAVPQPGRSDTVGPTTDPGPVTCPGPTAGTEARRGTVGSDRPATRPLGTVLKALALLDSLADTNEPVRSAVLARALGTTRAEAHRHLITLEAAGWMERLPDGAYRLTLRPARLGHAALRQAGVGERTAPLLERAAHAAGEVVSIAVLDSDTSRVVQRAEPGRSLHATLFLGDRLSLHSSASGRLLMAFATADVIEPLRLDGVPLPAEEDLSTVRATGWATSTDDDDDGIAALAIPLRRYDGPVVAALSVHGPRERFAVTEALAALRPAAHGIEQLLRLDTGAGLRLRA